MLRLRVLASAAVLAACMCTSPAAAQAVSDGSFESGNLDAWTVTGSSATGVAASGFAGYDAHSGDYFAALGDTSGNGSISQLLSTVAGQSYTLSYYLASKGDAQTTFSVLWNGQVLSGSGLVNPNSGKQYDLYSFLVTGTGSDLLTFKETDVPSFIALDDVTLTSLNGAVPEPATWAMMLIGFGGIGFAMRRKRADASLPQIA